MRSTAGSLEIPSGEETRSDLVVSLQGKMNRPTMVFLVSMLFVSLIGCGYKLRGTGDPIGLEIRSLAIPLIESPSSRLGFEVDFTSQVIQEFAGYAKIPLVSRDEAQAVLIGRIVEIEREPLSYEVIQTTVQGESTNYEVTRVRRLRVKLDAKLVDRATGKVIWEERAMEEKASYQVVTDPLVTRFSERKALEELARRLAKRIYMKTMERF